MEFDTAIVLGHSFYNNKLSHRQMKRLKKASDLYSTGEVKRVITTGGFGFFNKSDISLGKRVKIKLTELGIPEYDIYCEEVSKNTIENAKEALRLMQEKNLHSAVVITSWDHMFRSILIFSDIFPKEIRLDFVISDYFSTFSETIWDFFVQLAGLMKYFIKYILKK